MVNTMWYADEANKQDNNNQPNIEHLLNMKGTLLDYYCPQWKLNKNNLLVLHTVETKWWDVITAEQILQFSAELWLTDDEVQKFDIIANWTIIDRTISLWKGLVNKMVQNGKNN